MLADMARRIDRLEKGGRVPQANHTSWENVALPVYDADGTQRARIGRQLDDTFAVTYANGPAPSKPATPETVSRELGIVVAWSGKLVSQGAEVDPPADFARIDVHMSETDGFVPSTTETLVASLVSRGSVFVAADLNPKYVRLLAVSTSNAASEPSEQATAQAAPASNLAITDTLVVGSDGRIVAGDPNGARAQFSDQGFQQYDENGDLTVSIGSNPAAGNTLTVKGAQSETRLNFCDNPKLGINSDGWGGGNATLSRVSGANVGTEWAWRAEGVGSTNAYVNFPVRGLTGRMVAFQFTVYTNQPEVIKLRVDGQDPQGNYIPATEIGSYDFAAGDETHVISGVFMVPDDMLLATPHLTGGENDQWDAGQFMDVSLCCVEESAAVRPFFDGDSTVTWPDGEATHGVWSGESDQSVSTLLTPPTRVRENLIDNPKLAVNADKWGQYRVASYGRVDGANVGADWCYEVVTDATQPNPSMQCNFETFTRPLHPYTFSITVWCDADINVRLYFDEFNGPTYLNSTYGSVVMLQAGTARTVTTTLTIDPSVTHVYPFVYCVEEQPPAARLQASLAIIEEATDTFNGYFDGDSPHAAWLGEANNSNSVMVDIGTFRTETFASLSDQGTLSVQRLSTGELNVGGTPLRELVDAGAGTTLGWGYRTDESPHTTTEIGWFETSFIAPPKRLISVFAQARLVGADKGGVLIRHTRDGTTPTVHSPVLAGAEIQKNETGGLSMHARFPDNALVRLLMTVHSFFGAEIWLDGGPLSDVAIMWAEDAGPAIEPAQVLNTGGGETAPDDPPAPPPPPPPQRYDTQWRAYASQCFNRHGVRGTNIAVQGFYADGWNGHNQTQFGWDEGRIQSDLAGSVIEDVAVYVYAWHWYYNAGGTIVFGRHHDSLVVDGTYNIDTYGWATEHTDIGVGHWCHLPVWVGEGFRDGWITGLNFDAVFLGTSLEYYGKFNWDIVLSIGYRK